MDNFSTDQSASEQTADQPTFTVGDREFTSESAATKIANADSHISTLEAERQAQRDTIASLEAKLAQSTSLDDALAKLQQPANSQDSQPLQNTTAVSEEQIGEIVRQQMEADQATQRAAADQATATTIAEQTFKDTEAALRLQYGDKVNEVMNSKAKEWGVSVSDLVQRASDPLSAKLLLGSLKIEPSVTEATPSGSFNTGSLAHNAPEKFVDYSKSVSSSSIVDALKKADAGY